MNDKGRSEMLGMRWRPFVLVALAITGATVGSVAGWHLTVEWRIVAALLGAAIWTAAGLIVTPSPGHTEPTAALPLWRDRDGDIWRENADGTLTLAWIRDGWIRDGSGRTHAVVYAPALTHSGVEHMVGPLVRLREIRSKGDHR